MCSEREVTNRVLIPTYVSFLNKVQRSKEQKTLCTMATGNQFAPAELLLGVTIVRVIL